MHAGPRPQSLRVSAAWARCPWSAHGPTSIATSSSSSPARSAPAGGGGVSRGSGTTGPGSGTRSRTS
eukprot:4105085-Lingulodinium_polyedra.AAC.1